MLENTAKAFLMDQNSVILVICLTLLAFVITKTVIDNPFIAAISLPSYFFGAMFSYYWLRELGFAPTADKVANIAFACGIGFMLAILALVLTYRLVTTLLSR